MQSNFNPRAPYGARRHKILDKIQDSPISIHAPHTGRDPTTTKAIPRVSGFQSTRPIRGATLLLVVWPGRQDFNPRAPYGARLAAKTRHPAWDCISIHAPHTGRDRFVPVACKHAGEISIHAPHTGRDENTLPENPTQSISIHAPHTGRDPCETSFASIPANFNPRAPYGARRRPTVRTPRSSYFNPRAPYGARRPLPSLSKWTARFQSTRPIRGATFRKIEMIDIFWYFNPRAPYGARRAGHR